MLQYPSEPSPQHAVDAGKLTVVLVALLSNSQISYQKDIFGPTTHAIKMIVQAKLCQPAAVAHYKHQERREVTLNAQCGAARRTSNFKKQKTQLSAIGSSAWRRGQREMQRTAGWIDSRPSSSTDDASGEEATVTILSRRALSGSAAAALSALLLPDLSHWGIGTGQAQASPASQPLQPLGTYQSQLKEAQDQLDAVGAQLRSMAAADDDAEQPLGGDRSVYGKLQRDLHRGQLGRFWAIARGADQYVDVAVPGESRGSLARDEADLFSLIPERTGPLAALLKPNWDNPDDPLCLVYSCVNDPGAPPSINALYALKLLHVGLGIGAGGDSRVTPEGLLANVEDAADKLNEYSALLAKASDKLPQELLGADGSLAGGRAPPASAASFGPSPLG